MSHPLVQFLLARYDEEDPDRTSPAIEELRSTAIELECRMLTGDEPYLFETSVSEREVAWWALRMQGFMYRERDDFQDEWRVWPDPKAPRPTP